LQHFYGSLKSFLLAHILRGIMATSTPRGRPLSPHLQVYNLPITARLSVLHRATGMALVFGTILLVAWLGVIASGSQNYLFINGILASWMGKIALIGFSFSLIYHLCNGVRHLFWDIGKGFENSCVNRTAYLTITIAVALTAGIWLLTTL
jgi:succinate dehydrogenase / fumarate reductase, cytochrome b subunit